MPNRSVNFDSYAMDTYLFEGHEYIVHILKRYPQPAELQINRVICVPRLHPSGALAVELILAAPVPERFAVITLDLQGLEGARPCGSDESYLNVRACQGWLLPFLLKHGLAEPTGYSYYNSFDQYYLWKFHTETFFADSRTAGTFTRVPLVTDIPRPDVPPTPDDVPPPPAEEDIPDGEMCPDDMYQTELF